MVPAQRPTGDSAGAKADRRHGNGRRPWYLQRTGSPLPLNAHSESVP
jgi:hypothetical protein